MLNMNFARESSGCLLLGTTATGLEECLVKELRCKIPSVIVLGVPGDHRPLPTHIVTGAANISITGAGRVFFWISWAPNDEANALKPLSELFAVEKLFVVVGRGALPECTTSDIAPQAAVVATVEAETEAEAGKVEQSSGVRRDGRRAGGIKQRPLVCGVSAWLAGYRVWQLTASMRRPLVGVQDNEDTSSAASETVLSDNDGCEAPRMTRGEACGFGLAQAEICPRFQIVKRYRKGGSNPEKQRRILELAATLEAVLGWQSTTAGDHQLEVHVRPSTDTSIVCSGTVAGRGCVAGAQAAGEAGAKAGGVVAKDHVWLMLALTTEPVSWRGRLVSRGREHSVTTLRQSVAYALGSLAGLGERSAGEVCVDPMCGSGTVAEVATTGLNAQVFYLSGDNAEVAVVRARRNVAALAKRLGRWPRVDVVRWDATRLPLRSGVVSSIVTDMPFGDKSGSAGSNARLYPLAMGEFWRVLQHRPKGASPPQAPCANGTVLLMSTERKLLGRLAQEGRLWKQHRKLSLNLGGKAVAIMNLGKRYESRPADSKAGSGTHIIAFQDKHQAYSLKLEGNSPSPSPSCARADAEAEDEDA